MSIPSRHKDNHEQVQQLSVMLGKAEGFHMCERHNTLDGSLEAGRDDLLGLPPNAHSHRPWPAHPRYMVHPIFISRDSPHA